jgi:hypothetical protein
LADPAPHRGPADRDLIEKGNPVHQAERSKSDRFVRWRTGEEQVFGLEDFVPARDLGQGIGMIGSELDVESRIQIDVGRAGRIVGLLGSRSLGVARPFITKIRFAGGLVTVCRWYARAGSV